MGCPQSKSRDLNPDVNGTGDVNGRKSRNDAVRPEPEQSKHAPAKATHNFNDDPAVMGISENLQPIIPANPNPNLAAKKSTHADDNQKASKSVETNVANKPTISNANGDAKPLEIQRTECNEGKTSPHHSQTLTTAKSASEAAVAVSLPDYNSESESNAVLMEKEHNKRKLIKKTIEDRDAMSHGKDTVLTSAFIPDVDAPDSPTYKRRLKSEAVDLSDVSLSEKALNTSPKETSKTPVRDPDVSTNQTPTSLPDLCTPDDNKPKEKPNPWEGSSAVRHINEGQIQYGIPKGVPEPAPPKSRKSDIVTPTTFVLADRLVDEAPNDALAFNKLAGYLTGTVKKSELQKADDDEPDAGANNPQLPAAKPVITRKKDIVTDVQLQFKHIDENAKNTPGSCLLSVDRLASHLCSVATSDLEKIRAFYFWVCNNISYMYDKEKTLSDKLRYDATSTLRQGQGSYVNLMAALCKEVNIPVVTIPGCSKGLRHQPDKEFKLGERNHSWNAVYFNGEWRFLDCTWGSGYVDVSGKFQRQFDEFWFLTDPEVFCYDHFPAHPAWQLLEEPIEIEEFNQKPCLTEKSRELGFKLISHREPIVYFSNEVTISFATENYPLSNITADLRDEGGTEINSRRCMRRLDNKTFEVRVVPPEVGEYTLNLYGKARDYLHAKFRKLVDYTLRCNGVYPTPTEFPDHKKAWGPEPNYAELGFTDAIQSMSVFSRDSAEMSIELEQTRLVTILAELKASSDDKKELEGYTMVTARENSQTVHIRFPALGYYRLDLFAEGKTEKFEFAAMFLLECTANATNVKKFPKFNADSVAKHICEILEPKDYEISAKSTISFKIRSLKSKNVMVGVPVEESYGSRMEKLGDLKADEECVFSGTIKTPGPGKTVYISGSAAPPNVFWSRLYEYITK
ncbi:uncharacterized protein LOC127868307 [Dreissena polymorpha]|uniref:uncharacterized protein LOC127868307 n=1 Tax=Dreissena polymorpha TaxID=45954 RepID=UPI0022654C22|nr:uncharacterized protein LOC127868307 [Dreissena polymorpha]